MGIWTSRVYGRNASALCGCRAKKYHQRRMYRVGSCSDALCVLDVIRGVMGSIINEEIQKGAGGITRGRGREKHWHS